MSGPGDASQRRDGNPATLELTATAIVRAPVETVFDALSSWERQGEWIPFTTVRVVEGDGGEGSWVEAVTAIGPAILRDQMRVVRLDRPYEIRVMHDGRVLRGPGVMRCTPLENDGTQVVWHEWFLLPGGPLGKLAAPLLWPGSKAGLTQALRRFARLVEEGRLP
jgi:uncharacterized protein YndB with AHSA1/START domain